MLRMLSRDANVVQVNNAAPGCAHQHVRRSRCSMPPLTLHGAAGCTVSTKWQLACWIVKRALLLPPPALQFYGCVIDGDDMMLVTEYLEVRLDCEQS